MKGASTLSSEITLVFENAGVRFIIGIAPGEAAEGAESGGEAALHIGIKDASGEKDLEFTDNCSPVLADFIGGFVRWLSTIGITAAHSGGEIKGSFHPDYNVYKLIQASGAVCDMLEQRFSLYTGSILA